MSNPSGQGDRQIPASWKNKTVQDFLEGSFGSQKVKFIVY